MKAKLKLVLSFLLTFALGGFVGMKSRDFASRVTSHRAIVDNREKKIPDLVVVGESTGIEVLDVSQKMVFRVKILQVLKGSVGDSSTIRVELPTLSKSNSELSLQTIKIDTEKFEAVFVLEKIGSDIYRPIWIVPSTSFRWRPESGLVNFIAYPEWPN